MHWSCTSSCCCCTWKTKGSKKWFCLLYSWLQWRWSWWKYGCLGWRKFEFFVQDELKRYQTCKGIKLRGDNGGYTCPLEWWKKHHTTYPIVWQLAQRILAIPATSASSDRVFSTAAHVVNKKRERLDLFWWFRGGIRLLWNGEMALSNLWLLFFLSLLAPHRMHLGNNKHHFFPVLLS